jgi:peptidoglycan/LPS O-acetylase OafA/YrhL
LVETLSIANEGRWPSVPVAGHRVQTLDAVRGAAIVLVVLWHYFPHPLSPAGRRSFAWIRAGNVLSWSGVDLFFVLSGFLIVGILIDHRGSTNYFGTFYLRRACRILPLYLVALGLSAVSIDLLASWRLLVPYLVFQQNALMAATGTWGLPRLDVTWSLAIEEQFYLLAPLLVRVSSPKRLPLAFLACLVAAPVFRIAAWVLLPPTLATFSAFMLLPCRMDSLACGALVACAVRDERWRPLLASKRLLAGIAVLAGVPGIVVPLVKGWDWQAPFVSIAGFSFIAIFYGVVVVGCSARFATRGLGSSALRPLAALGIGAYSIYLFHLTILDWANAALAVRVGALSTIVYYSILLAANAGIAALSWKLIEQPMIRWSHRHRYSE